MGEVYRAKDSRLKREVALKVLRSSVAQDGDRLARFQREAEVLASLNHPHIAQIYGIEEAGGATTLVMELVEGQDLAERIARGPIPVDEALTIAAQVADALEAAHERGIVHRDLKPANIRVRPDGTVKVLDFGLARGAPEPGIAANDLTNSPTPMSPTMTAAGVILGTAAYMSPEQARGKPVDRRADVWAFGAVLFEMLTGMRPFGGEDVTDTIASVLRTDPDWESLPADVPDVVRMLIRRCLEKDPRRRPSHLSVATFLLATGADAATSTIRSIAPVTNPRSRQPLIAVAATTLLLGAAVASAVTWGVAAARRPAVALAPIRFTITVETGGETWRNLTDRPFVISPDGRAVVYRAMVGGVPRMFIRRLDTLEPRQLVESLLVRTPFFSPDSQWVGFFDGPALRKVPASGGPPVTICQTIGGGFGASWGDDDSIVFAAAPIRKGATGYPGLMSVPASGGEPKALTTFDPERGEGRHAFPFVLPRSRGVLFGAATTGRDSSIAGRLMVLDRTSGERREISRSAGAAEYVDGHVIFSDLQGRLESMPFDLSTLKPSGPATPLADRVHVPTVGQPMFSTAGSGALAFLAPLEGAHADVLRTLVWVTRQGREEPIAAPSRAFASARLSPDATRIALDIRDEENDIWIWSIDRGVLSRLTSGPTLDMAPIWTPDGRRIIWSSTRDNNNPTLYVQAADGTGSPDRLASGGIAFPGSVTPDGRTVLAFNGSFILQRPLAGEGPAERLLGPSQTSLTPEVSPDGRWLAYQSNESGQPEVYVRPYPKIDDGRWQISTDRGTRPAWSRNGRELFFLDGTDRLSVAPIAVNGSTLIPGAPRQLLEKAYYPGFTSRGSNLRGYDVSPDGQRFLMIKSTEGASGSQSVMTIVVNWPPTS